MTGSPAALSPRRRPGGAPRWPARSGHTHLTDLRRADHETSDDHRPPASGRGVEDPISVEGQRVFVTLSVGFCLPGKTRDPGANAMMAAADRALAMARAAGGATVRGYDPGMARADIATPVTDAELAHALDAGEIQPWFQPQVAAGDGDCDWVSKFWRDGIIPSVGSSSSPTNSCPRADNRRADAASWRGDAVRRVAKRCGTWDRAGLGGAESVAVNFSPPKIWYRPIFADQIRWELDRFDLSPNRLTIEVLETVLDRRPTPRGIRNLRALANWGVGSTLTISAPGMPPSPISSGFPSAASRSTAPS